MRVTFSNAVAAQAAVKAFESFGYPAQLNGTEVQTSCPTLLAIPAIEKRVGLARVQRLDLAPAPSPTQRGRPEVTEPDVVQTGASRPELGRRAVA